MFDYEKFKSDIAAAIEKSLRKWAEENGEQFGRNYTYTEIFDEHCDKMAESYKKAAEKYMKHIADFNQS